MTNVGTISLDLVIKENLQKQLNGIKATIQNAMSKPIEQASNDVKKSVDNAFEGAAESVKEFTSNTKAEIEDIANKAVEPLAKMQEKSKEALDSIAQEAAKPIEKSINVKTTPIDWNEIRKGQEQVEQEVDEITKKIAQKYNGSSQALSEEFQEAIDKTLAKAREEFGNFDVPTDPVKRFKKELENTKEKADLLQKKWQELNLSLSSAKTDAEAEKLVSQINSTEKQLLSLQNQAERTQKKIEDINKESINVDNVEKPIKSLKKEVNSTVDEAKKKLSNFEVSNDPIKRLKQELENTKDKTTLLENKLKDLNVSLNSAQSEEEAEKIATQINKTEKQLISLQNQSDKTKQKIDEANKSEKKSTEKTTSAFDGLKSKIKSVTSSVKSGLVGGFKSLKSVASRTATTVKKTLGGAFSGLKTIAGKALDGIKRKFSIMNKSMSSLEKPTHRFGNAISSAFRRIFVMAGVLKLLTSLRSAIEDTANKNDEFAKSLNEIKANMKIAFTPIIDAVMPALNTLMDGLAKATKVTAVFLNELFGTTYKDSLNKLKKTQDVAKKTAKEAKKASTYLDSFDEMNVAPDNSKDSDKSDEDKSGIDYSAINGDDVKLPDWAQRMKDAIKSGDWAGVGKLLAEKLNGAFDKINWKKIQKKVNDAMRAIATGLNGFVKALNWKKLGETIGNGINTILGGLYTFMTTFDWGALGKGFAEGINGIIDTVDWDLLGRTLASKWNALIDFLYEFVTTFNWNEFGESIATAVNSWFDEINWVKIGQTISEGIKGLFSSVVGFINKLDVNKISQSIKDLIHNIDWAGIIDKATTAINGIFTKAYQFISSFDWGQFGSEIATSLNRTIEKIDFKQIARTIAKVFSSAIDVFYNFVTTFDWSKFGETIAESANTWFAGIDWAKLGKSLSESLKGLLDTIISFLDKFDWEKLGKAIGDFLVNIDWIGIAKKLFKVVKKAFFAAGDLLKGIGESIFGGISDYIENNFHPDMSNTTGEFSSFFENIKTIGKTTFDAIGESAAEMHEPVQEAALNMQESVGELLSSAGTILKDSLFIFTDEFAKWITDNKGKLVEMFNSFQQLGIDITDLFSTIFKDVGKIFSDWWSGEGSSIFRNISKAFWGVVDTLMNIWNKWIYPIISEVIRVIKDLWTEHLKPLVDRFVKLIGKIGNLIANVWNAIKPLVDWLVDTCAPLIKSVFKTVGNVFKDVFGAISDVCSGLFKSLGGVCDFLSGVFTGDWKKAWGGIKDIFSGIFEAIWGIFKGIINLIIDGLNLLWKGIYWVVSGIVNAIGGIAELIGDLFGCDWGWEMPEDPPLIPRLATGGIATAPTLAMVGDNPNARADPEVIAPLSKLKDMMSDGSGSSDEEIVILLREIVDLLKSLDITVESKINERTLWKSVVKMYREHKVRTGGALV